MNKIRIHPTIPAKLKEEIELSQLSYTYLLEVGLRTVKEIKTSNMLNEELKRDNAKIHRRLDMLNTKLANLEINTGNV